MPVVAEETPVAGNEVQVNSVTAGHQGAPHIATLADGGWVVS